MTEQPDAPFPSPSDETVDGIGAERMDGEFVNHEPAALAATGVSMPGGGNMTGLVLEQLLRVPPKLRLLAWKQAQSGASLYWLNYRAAEDCFLQGEDPLQQARQTPGLLWGSVKARADWPPLAELEVTVCMLDVDMLVCASRAQIEQYFSNVSDQIQISAVHATQLMVLANTQKEVL